MFFPARGDFDAVAAALAVCARCTVTEQCLEEHLEDKDGIYGGTTARQRRLIRSERPVNRRCLHCDGWFKAYSTQAFCSETCKAERHRQQKMASYRRAAL